MSTTEEDRARQRAYLRHETARKAGWAVFWIVFVIGISVGSEPDSTTLEKWWTIAKIVMLGGFLGWGVFAFAKAA